MLFCFSKAFTDEEGQHILLATCLDTTDFVATRCSLVQTEVQQAFMQYKYQAQAAEGIICICPMSQRDLFATTELLTQSFSESMGYLSVYRCAMHIFCLASKIAMGM